MSLISQSLNRAYFGRMWPLHSSPKLQVLSFQKIIDIRQSRMVILFMSLLLLPYL